MSQPLAFSLWTNRKAFCSCGWLIVASWSVVKLDASLTGSRASPQIASVASAYNAVTRGQLAFTNTASFTDPDIFILRQQSLPVCRVACNQSLHQHMPPAWCTHNSIPLAPRSSLLQMRLTISWASYYNEASDHLVDELHTDEQCLAADCLVWSHQIVTMLHRDGVYWLAVNSGTDGHTETFQQLESLCLHH